MGFKKDKKLLAAGFEIIGIIMNTVSDQIKQARLALGLTQKQVAEKTGISLVGYKRIETGKRWPAYSYLVKLAVVLKTSFIIEEIA